MRRILPIILGSVVLMFINAAIPYAGIVTIDPKAIGEPEKPFAASSIRLNYASAVTQTLTGSFSETGGGTFNNFYFPDSTTVVDKTGLNKDYRLSAVYTASGTATPTQQGFTATFNSFGLQVYANQILVGQSTGLVSGTAHLVPDSLVHAAMTTAHQPRHSQSRLRISGVAAVAHRDDAVAGRRASMEHARPMSSARPGGFGCNDRLPAGRHQPAPVPMSPRESRVCAGPSP